MRVGSSDSYNVQDHRVLSAKNQVNNHECPW